jgi:hypothetical protein
MNGEDRLKTANRSLVLGSYTAAVSENFIRYSNGDRKATSEYIYDNQKEDAMAIVGEFYHNNRRVVSITKKTKVGADGLMIELAKQMTTHPDDDFVINPANVRILTGMSNAGWEKDMKDKAPYCFKDKIFHHGQLKHSDLRGLKNSLIIIDELDNGDKERQVLHNTLKAAGALDIQYLEENNVRFVFISATMIKELYELYRWGEHHCLYKMTIPDSYIGHTEFLERGIIQEFYSLNTPASATKWVQEDIIDNYGPDFRIHIVRANQKTATAIQNACIQNGVDYRNHTSSDKIDESVLSDLFEGALTRHVVLIVKGFFRRANLIPNEWKLRIGATHELYTKIVDNNAQIQALPGRMTGYWRGVIESGHKTGPYRTSVNAVKEYEAVYNNPFGANSYQAAGFKKNNGRVTTITPTIVTPKNIAGLVPGDLPSDSESDTDNSGEFERGHGVFDTQAENEVYAKKCGAQRTSSYDVNDAGFKMCSTTSRGVHSLDDILKFTKTSKKGSNLDKKLSDLKVGECAYRRYVCYRDITDKSSECFVTIWVKRLIAAKE